MNQTSAGASSLSHLERVLAQRIGADATDNPCENKKRKKKRNKSNKKETTEKIESERTINQRTVPREIEQMYA